MLKSTESGMITISTESICKDLQSGDSLACLYALRYCAVNQIDSKEIISVIRKLKTSKLIEWGSCRISDCAIAALDLLSVENYSGSNPQINDLITTRFYTA